MRVELVKITKRFGELVADNDVSVTFEPGQVHGLLGENGAGKSTLMKVLAGWYRPEEGQVLLGGRPVVLNSPRDALAHGIGYVPQDPQDFPSLTVLEQLVVGRPGWTIEQRQLTQRLARVNESLGFDLAPGTRVANLSVGQRLQMAMAQVVIHGAHVIILDEPPMGSSIGGSLRRLADEGKTVVYITHNVTDAVALCDQITVLRRGRRVGTVQQPVSQSDLVRMMFEDDLPTAARPPLPSNRVLATLAHVSTRTDPPLRDVSVEVRAGEVVGLAGIEGSGQVALLSVLGGRAAVTDGRRETVARRPHMVPAGRLGEGLVDGFTAEEMLALAHPSRVGSRGWRLDGTRARRLADDAIKQFSIRGRPQSPARSLSGGNQQRLMLAAVPFDVDLLLLDSPTRGLDVPTAAFIWSWILEQCARGAGVVVASTELEELWEHATRILVLARGQVVGEVVPTPDNFELLKQLVGGASAQGEIEAE